MTDLFGADLPVEGSEGGVFAWRDGPLLQALKAGSWVVLDEVNLLKILKIFFIEKIEKIFFIYEMVNDEKLFLMTY